MRSVHLAMVVVGLAACVAHRYEIEPDVPGPSPMFKWTVIPSELSTGLVPSNDLWVYCKYNGTGAPKYMEIGRICEPYGATVVLAFMRERGGGAVQRTDAATDNMAFDGSLPEKFFAMTIDNPVGSDACVYACHAQVSKKRYWDYVDVHEVGTTVEELAYLVQKNAFDIHGGGDITVRLLGGDARYGAVEVTRQMEFGEPESVESGLLCDDDFDDNNQGATVVCRMLGFDSGIFIPTDSFYNASAQYEGDFVLDNVECRGTETNLAACPSNEWGQENCDLDDEVAGVRCSMHNDTYSQYSVHLLGGDGTFGAVEVARWVHVLPSPFEERGLLCTDEFDDNNLGATVVCRMLGFDIGESIPADTGVEYSGYFALDDVRCVGNETNLDECPSNVWGDNNCDISRDVAGVRCSFDDGGESGTGGCSVSESCYSVRLFGGHNDTVGVVEVTRRHAGGTDQPGLLCDDYFDTNTRGPTVVCRMLGFNSGTFIDPDTLDISDHGGLDIVLDNVMCFGPETNLADCYSRGWGTEDCSSQEVAGVQCSDDPPSYSYQNYTVDLVGGGAAYGAVQVSRVDAATGATESGLVCDDHFGSNDLGANVVCRMLGYDHGQYIDGDIYAPSGFDGDFVLDNVRCVSGNETNLGQCWSRDWGSDDCSEHEVAGAECWDGEGPTILDAGSSHSHQSDDKSHSKGHKKLKGN